MLRKTNKDVLCKAKWLQVFGENKRKTIWKTIHSGVIDNWDFDIIYKLILNVKTVRKNLYHWRIVPKPACLGCADVGSILDTLFFYCPKNNIFIKNVEPIFKKRFGNDFKLNLYRVNISKQFIFAINY